MVSFSPSRRFGAISSCIALSASLAVAQPGGREAMWPAPTAEDWKKPVLIQWQRIWDDAVRLSRETGKAILVCANMDGEIASEHYAGIRYRSPEIAKLYEPYVCLMASVYRHNARDYDENGKRIPCPRFGCVTCGEHIAIEPVVYEKFFDGKRIAPRHVMVELDGKETYDIYYAFDTDSVFGAIRDGIANRNAPPPKLTRGDRSIVERVESPDSNDRTAVEQAYVDGDRETRRRLLEAAVAEGEQAPVGLLRLAIFGLDVELGQLARKALMKTRAPGAVDLISEALRVPMEAAERDSLIAALGQLGESSPRARMLAVVHKGLVQRSTAVDVDGWDKALAGAEYPAPADFSELANSAESTLEASTERPTDPDARLASAEASLALVSDPNAAQALPSNRRAASKYSKLMYEDARREALEAEKLGATGWRVHSILATSAYYLGNRREAYERAEKAMADAPRSPTSWASMITVELFAEKRRRAITRALRRKEDWPGQWLTDLHAAYSVLSKHPLGNAHQVVSHYDFLKWFGAKGPAYRALDAGLQRYPDAWVLHDRLRSRILEEKGLAGLESTYEVMLEKKDAAPSLSWYAGYTSIVAAEFHRRRGDQDKALEAYGRAVAHYERSIASQPHTKPTADHYVALAFAGRARVAFEQEDLARAVTEVLASFERKPDAAATLDGLNISPVGTAKTVLAKLRGNEATSELAAKLDAALRSLDPSMLELPAFETAIPDDGAGRRDLRGGDRQRGGAGRGRRGRRDR